MTKIENDTGITAARKVVDACRSGNCGTPEVAAFFDEATYTVSYVVHDPETSQAAIVDSVLDYDPASGRTSHKSADAIIVYVKQHKLDVAWHIETHVHADHLSAAPYLQRELGGKIAIGEKIAIVQGVFGKLFNAGADFQANGTQFDHLFCDGERFDLGDIPGIALHVPGHTPADMAFVIGDAVFVGDTMFMPDYGTARADFPGGDARQLFRSIKRLLSLPDEARLYMCHDYKAPGRDEFAWQTTVAEQRVGNVHAREGVKEDEFVEMRTARDATLGMPTLILPSVQVNMRAGHFPEAEENGVRYLKIPVNEI